MKEWEKAWLACAIDGEGCICMIKAKDSKSRHTKRGFHWKIQILVCNSNENFVRMAQKIAGIGKIKTHRRASEPWKKITYEWRCGDRGIEQILPLISKYFICKVELSKLALEARRLIRAHIRLRNNQYDKRLEEIRQLMKYINRRKLKWQYQREQMSRLS